jgi:iron complex transport system substrate-binding protein
MMLVSCAEGGHVQRGTDQSYVESISKSDAKITAQYAKGFKVKYLKNGVRLLEVGDSLYHFALVPRGMKVEEIAGIEDYEVIYVPIEKAVFMTMPQISNAIALERCDVVAAMPSVNNLFDATINAQLQKGVTTKIGKEGNFDVEKVIATQPDLVFFSPFKRGGYDRLREVGVKLVPHLGYKELTPLGQAEWIKFLAMFTGDEVKANRTFAGIAQRYEALRKMVEKKVTTRPLVFSGEMHGGNWFAVGGKNYLAQVFYDAGAQYVMSDNTDTGGVNVEFEQMYALAANADYWRILNSFRGNFTYEALAKSEPRNTQFKAWKDKGVIYCNMTTTPYYESATMHPDILLQDFIYVFHPELAEKGYKPVYYKLLTQ